MLGLPGAEVIYRGYGILVVCEDNLERAQMQRYNSCPEISDRNQNHPTQE